MTEILSARNINGLLLGQPAAGAGAPETGLVALHTAVTFGRQVVSPNLNSATTDHFHSMRLVMRHLKQFGYRRIGFACWPRVLESVDRNWTGAYFAYHTSPHHALPIYAVRNWNKATFAQWLKKYRPEVVISNDFEVLHWLRGMGLRVPEDIGFAVPSQAPGPRRLLRHRREQRAGRSDGGSTCSSR